MLATVDCIKGLKVGIENVTNRFLLGDLREFVLLNFVTFTMKNKCYKHSVSKLTSSWENEGIFKLIWIVYLEYFRMNVVLCLRLKTKFVDCTKSMLQREIFYNFYILLSLKMNVSSRYLKTVYKLKTKINWTNEISIKKIEQKAGQ